MKTSSMIAAIALATLAATSSAAAPARRQGVPGGFPDVARVKADYPDDAERFIAFDILFNRLGEATRGKQTHADYELGNAYFNARGEILAAYERQGNRSEVYRKFTARSGALFSDPNFRRSVLAKYGLPAKNGNGPADAGGATPFVLFPEQRGDASDAAIKAAFFEALPVWAAGLLAMLVVTWVLMRSAGVPVVEAPPAMKSSGALPQLPDTLRVVSVPGRRYAVVMATGQVIDKESSVHTTVRTTTTGGQVQVQDGGVYQTPIQTHTSVMSTREELVWIRTPDGGETTWTLYGGTFKTRQGHVISSIARPLPDGTSDLLLVYNHTTDQFEVLSGVDAVHATRFLWPTLLAALAGSIPGAIGLGVLFHRLGGLSGPLVFSLLTLWIMAGIASAIIAPFMALRMMKRVASRRNAAFMSDYVPECRRFLLESTPALTRHFAQL